MKRYLLLLVLLFANKTIAQNFHDAQGKLDISNSGQATYTLPIAMPPSIKDVGPVINLVYASGQLGGIAGQGWNISSVSNISRMATRKDIDGFVDGVDFDDNDKLALDGQRLILKSGTYWADGSTYVTEVQSNTKIELKGSGTSMYFIVTAPDGSRSWYGNYGGLAAYDYTSFYIVRFEDTNGNYVSYDYRYPIGNTLVLWEIKFSGNTNGLALLNSIKFNYKVAKRTESAYIKGESYSKSALLDYVEVRTSGQLFRTYKLEHSYDAQLGYEKVIKLQEYNGAGEAANPVIFEYFDTTNTSTAYSSVEHSYNYTNNLSFDKTELSGDFDGDGRLDFTTDKQLFNKLFIGSSGQNPIDLPFTVDKRKTLVATTLSNNKLNQFQSIVLADETANAVNFKVYNLSGNLLPLAYEKNININNIGTKVGCETGTYLKGNNLYYEGDYNGDGVAEVLIISSKNEIKTYTIRTFGHETECFGIVSNNSLNYSIVDLNPNSSTTLNTNGYVQIGNSTIVGDTFMAGASRYVADFNSDGKSDILIVNYDKSYKIVGFKQLTTAPWVELEVLGQGTIDAYSSTKQMLFGDYNGDGKTDVMLPATEGGSGHTTWYVYYGNPKPIGGEFFVKETHNIVEYWPDTGNNFKYSRQTNQYYAIDVNKDGKSDIVRVWTDAGTDRGDAFSKYRVSNYVNNTGNTLVTGNKFTLDFESWYHYKNYQDRVVAIASSYDTGTNNELVIVDKTEKFITYYDFVKDVSKDVLLKKVTSSEGNIVDEITYGNLDPIYLKDTDGNTGSNYTLGYSSIYPFVDLNRIPSSKLVSKLKNTSQGITKYQDFRYQGFVVNMSGLGAIGFHKTARSAWYQDPSAKRIWTVAENNPNWRGATKRAYTQLINVGSSFSFWYDYGGFPTFPTGMINSTTNVFSSNTDKGTIGVGQTDLIISQPVLVSQDYQASNSITASSAISNNTAVNYQANQIILTPGFSVNSISTGVFRAYIDPATATNNRVANVYNIKLDKQIVKDEITGVTTEITNTYDPNFFLPVVTVTQNILGGVVQGTSTVTNEFENNPTGTGTAYYIGRPKKSSTVTTAYGDTFSTEQKFTYANNNLSRLEKKGNTTNAIYQTEDYEYDAYGNIKKKTLSVPGATPIVVARTTEYTYDPTARFVKTVKDIEGLVITNNTYHPLYGMVLSSSNPFGFTTTSIYDNWGKPKQVTDFLGKSIYYAYAKSSNEYTTTKTRDDGSSSIAISDALGRTKKAGSKNIDGTWSYKSVEYDFMGRKYRESEPYASGSPTLWNTSVFDDYNRVITSTTAKGLTTNITYNGLTVTGNDGTKTTSSTKNANGHVITATDDGGTINYTFYANGNLRTTNYLNTIISMEYNEWGVKTKLTDPSAGTYTYKYNALGEPLEETTPPNGVTIFTLNNVGKLTKKTISGTNTNSETTYTYDPTTKMPTGSSYKDILDGNKITNYTYEYDTSKRLYKTTEATPYATFIKQLAFDAFGRVEKETLTATTNGKTSSKTIKNTYKNGLAWQILDDLTQQVLWQTNTVNERGQLLTAQLGNGIAITNTYDQYGYTKQFKHDKTGGANVMTLNTVFDVQKGNLSSRTNSMFSWSENFTYDSLDRLTSYKNAQGVLEIQDYDVRGRITQNNLGAYNYSNTAKAYQNTSVTISPEAKTYYTAKPTLNVTYNTFKSPYQIEEVGVDKVSFTYNDGNDRSTMFYGGLGLKETRQYRKHYAADGSMEIKENRITGTLEFITYIGGDAYSAPIVLKSNGTSQNYLYLHRDYQGSILAVTDGTGVVIEKRLFDAWGSLIYVQNGAGVALSGLTVLDRGYTGHEHLQSVGLIHMNGRLYDPKLHRFLQPDNYVQDPYNTQNYNRYGYCLNNPLKYTDPSGEFAIGVAILIGTLISVATYVGTAIAAGVQVTFSGILNSAIIGAFSSAVTFGIGTFATNGIQQLGTRMVFQALAHGTFQGVMAGMQGGNFWSGFASGSLSSIAAGLWQGGGMESGSAWKGLGGSWGSGDFGTIAFGTVSGGAGAALTGGNFWQGAATGLVVSLLNEVAHKVEKRSMIIEDLARAGFNDPYAIADISQSNINDFASDVFPGIMEKAGTPSFRLVDIIEGYPDAEGVTKATLTPKGWRVLNSIEIKSTSLRSYYRLANNISHELNHAYHYASGKFDKWYKKYGDVKATAMTEYASYLFNKVTGGIVNQYQLDYNLRIIKNR